MYIISPQPEGCGTILPLNPDFYFLYTLLVPEPPHFPGSVGLLDLQGQASAVLTFPTGGDPGLAGVVLHHAWVGPPSVPQFASNSVALTLTP